MRPEQNPLMIFRENCKNPNNEYMNLCNMVGIKYEQYKTMHGYVYLEFGDDNKLKLLKDNRGHSIERIYTDVSRVLAQVAHFGTPEKMYIVDNKYIVLTYEDYMIDILNVDINKFSELYTAIGKQKLASDEEIYHVQRVIEGVIKLNKSTQIEKIGVIENFNIIRYNGSIHLVKAFLYGFKRGKQENIRGSFLIVTNENEVICRYNKLVLTLKLNEEVLEKIIAISRMGEGYFIINKNFIMIGQTLFLDIKTQKYYNITENLTRWEHYGKYILLSKQSLRDSYIKAVYDIRKHKLYRADGIDKLPKIVYKPIVGINRICNPGDCDCYTTGDYEVAKYDG